MNGECLYCNREIADYKNFCNDECEYYYENEMEATDSYDYISNNSNPFGIDEEIDYDYYGSND